MTHSAAQPFHLVRSQEVASLNLTIEEYQHKATGAQHIHLASDYDENVFLVALRTVPKDSTGVAHILEHTALCGSEKYPVRDPFFMMIRRSLNTFMNAFTSSDWTAYPFASQNKKDFNNLLDVYLDAVFFSRLDPLDFAQEGHRLDFSEAGNSKSDLMYKGVVYNEMKGAMSSINSQLWQTLSKYLFPTTTYHYNSGGDPESITDLSYDQLLAFYKTHYHPSNAIFMTFGNISAAEHQAKFEAQALKRFEKLEEHIFVPEEKRYYSPVRVMEGYPYNDAKEQETESPQSLSEKTHIVMGWLLGKSTNLVEALEAQLLSSILFDNSASPLQHVLETTDLGNSPSPLCGLDDSQHEISFVCGIEGSDIDKADAFEQLILDTLQHVAQNGVPQEDLEAALHQLELQQREISGDSYPYGLQLILTALSAATHRGDPIGLLDIDPAIVKLRDAIKEPDFIQNLVRKLLLDNPHRVRLTLAPDEHIQERKQAAERRHLDELKASLNEQQKQAIIDQAKALEARQQQKDDMSVLPKVGIEDVPANMHHVTGDFSTTENFPVASYQTGTNGLVYQQAIIDIPSLTDEELQILGIYSACLSELGINEEDYLSVQKRQSQIVGSLNCFTSIRSDVHDPQKSRGHIILSAKALAKNHIAMTDLMAETLHGVRFDEHNRIRELVAQMRARREQSVTGSGHSLAMSAATANMSPLSSLNHRVSGLGGIQFIKLLDKQLQNPEGMEKFSATLLNLHKKITQQSMQFLLVSDETNLPAQHSQLIDSWRKHYTIQPARMDGSEIELQQPDTTNVRQSWLTNTQVNFCAKAFPTVAMTHADAAPLTVLGGFLRNGYLHRTIREQGGAYGGGAQQDSNSAAFRFYSYRDPRLSETLEDFSQSIQWLKDTDHAWLSVEEAILGVISSIDKPGSPAGEAKQAFHAELNGRTIELRETFRKQVLEVKEEDLKRVADKYLSNDDTASIAVIAPPENKQQCEDNGLASLNL